jgi:hypothetical protein
MLIGIANFSDSQFQYGLAAAKRTAYVALEGPLFK